VPRPPALSHFIDGRFVPAGRSSFENRHPATGEVINLVPEADSAAVDDAVKAAKRALKGPWGKMSEQQRSAILRKVADAIMARFDDFLAAEMARYRQAACARLACRHSARRGELQGVRRPGS
jgi:aminomuconate-semialdehyde/2-hydroxymuconate-6-semialdehyde dehydrogenase